MHQDAGNRANNKLEKTVTELGGTIEQKCTASAKSVSWWLLQEKMWARSSASKDDMTKDEDSGCRTRCR